MRNSTNFVTMVILTALVLPQGASAQPRVAPATRTRSAAPGAVRSATPAGATRSAARSVNTSRSLKVSPGTAKTAATTQAPSANDLLVADARNEATYKAELDALNDDLAYKRQELTRLGSRLELKKSEYVSWFSDDCESNNGYTTGAGLAQKCNLCTGGKEPNEAKNGCIESDGSKEEKMEKDRDNCERKNAFWKIIDEENFKGQCIICSGAYEPGYAMNDDGTMGNVMSCQKTAALIAQEKADEQQELADAAKITGYETMYNTAKSYLDSNKSKKLVGSIRLGPGTYGYELSGAGGGGGGGGSSKSLSCKKKSDGGDGGNGELKTGTFTLNDVTNVEFSVGGNTNTAGDCGYGGSDDGTAGGDSTIKYEPGNDATTITAAGGGAGKWEDSRRKATPSGNGAQGGEGGGKGRPDPQHGRAGWFLLTSYTPLQ